jgi:selenide,water dikinase
MADRSQVRVVVDTAGIVAYPGAAAAAATGARTGGDPRNRDYLLGHLDSTAPAGADALCFDPQTSGGLLAAVDPDVAADLVADDRTDDKWWRVGEIEIGAPLLVLR